MEYKKNAFLSEHYIYSCKLSLQFRNTSFDKLLPQCRLLYCDYHYVTVAFLFNSDNWFD